MNHTESPNENSTPDAAEHAAPVEPPAAAEAGDAAANAGPASSPTAESASSATEALGEEGGDSERHEAQPGQPGAMGDKKKRRRRRRKKHDGGPHDGTAEAAGTVEEAAAESAVEAAGEGAAAKSRGDAKKREKRRGPPRERPPVNAGDIVFGKIIEITDEAILVDIPGKAKAIFDRRELLLSDDDDQPPHPAPGAGEAEAFRSEEPPSDKNQLEEEISEGGPVQAGSGVGDTGTEVATSIQTAPSETPAASDTSTSTGSTDDPSHEVAPGDAPPPLDPKVPRVTLEVGADFIAVVHNDGARGGYVVLTHHPHRAERAKAVVEKAFNEKTTVLGLVTGVIKGGVEVDVDGLRAFVPGSHIDLRLGSDLSYLVAKRLPFLVTQYAKRGRDLVLSRKAMIEEEAKKARTDALSRLKIGEEIEGTVRSVVSFGAFIDVGGIEGLVPLQEMSHNRGDGPNDIFKAGETTRVKVLKIDERGKVWLSHKATVADPWNQVAEKYAAGTKHSGKVARLQPFGAFIELESGVDGLIHLADLSINRIESPSEVVKVGDPIEVVVSHVDPSNHKIALHPAPTGEAAGETPQRVVPHRPVKCKVVLIETGGVVVRILGVTGRSSRGYITSAGTGTPRGTELRKVFKIGQELEAKVIEMDPRRGEVKLSIKAFSEEQERSAYQQYRQQLKAEARFTFADLLTKKVPPPQR